MQNEVKELKCKKLDNADVYFGIESEFVAVKIKEVFLSGNVLFVYEKDCREVAKNLALALEKEGYRVCMKAVDEKCDIPEYARFIIAIGHDKALIVSKELAKRLEISYAVLLTSPTIFDICDATQIYLDESILSRCGAKEIASAWGVILSEPFADFEEFFAGITAEEKKDKTENCDVEDIESVSDLAYRLLQIRAKRNVKDNATVMAEFLRDTAINQGIEQRGIGEYKFISATILTTLYDGFLRSPAFDCMIPPKHDEKLEKIALLTGKDIIKYLNSFDFFDTNSYFRINYILGEYRVDLLEKLSALDVRKSERRWRRLYPDAGYWISKAFDADTLLGALKLSGEIGNGLFRYICETGFLENFAI